jgi:hypothetical protein
MTDVDRPTGKLDLARVLRDTFAAIRGDPRLIWGTLGIVLAGALFNYFNLRAMGLEVSTPTPVPHFTPLSLGGGLIGFVIGMVYLTALTAAALAQLEGRTLTPGEIVEVVTQRVLPVTGLTILWAIGVTFGFMLFFVPGLILVTMWFASLPALVGEPIGVFRAFGRSRALTRGNRWRLFGLMLLLLIVLMVIEGVFVGSLFSLGRPAALGPVRIIVLSLLGGGFNLVVYVMLSAVYVQLRELRGGGSDTLARVFE